MIAPERKPSGSYIWLTPESHHKLRTDLEQYVSDYLAQNPQIWMPDFELAQNLTRLMAAFLLGVQTALAVLPTTTPPPTVEFQRSKTTVLASYSRDRNAIILNLSHIIWAATSSSAQIQATKDLKTTLFCNSWISAYELLGVEEIAHLQFHDSSKKSLIVDHSNFDAYQSSEHEFRAFKWKLAYARRYLRNSDTPALLQARLEQLRRIRSETS